MTAGARLRVAAPPGAGALLSSVPLLAGLEEDAADELASRAAWVRLPAGTLLFARGDQPDGFYVVARGRLRVRHRRDESGVDNIELGPGDAVGELGMLAGSPRSADVHAVRDSTLAVLDDILITEVFEGSGPRAMGLARLVAKRMDGGPARRRARPASVTAIVGADGTGAADAVVDALRSRIGVVAIRSGEHGSDNPVELIERLEQAGSPVLVVCDGVDPEWQSQAARQADLVFAAVEARGRADRRAVDLLAGLQRSAAPASLEAVVLQRPGVPPRDTAAWLDQLGATRAHHVVGDGCWDRVARRVMGREVGVVLSGGGARAMAHLGVLRAIAGAGLPIDVLGGTSMGGLVAAAVASSGPVLDRQQIDAVIERVRTEMQSLDLGRRFTLPVLSLLSVRRVERAYDRLFEGRDLEDAWRTVFVTTADLTACSLAVTDRGSMANWVRATATAPGLWPLVADRDGHLHADGAVFDNLPVEPMVGCGVDRVLAVNVSNRATFEVQPGSPQIRSPIDLVRERARRGPGSAFPILGSVLGRTVVVASLAKQNRAALVADAVIEPDVSGVAIADYRSFDRMVDAGDRAAQRWLEESGTDEFLR